jgi:hypothetical protein
MGDPHVPASALKLWFRELYEPLISDTLYDECMAAFDNVSAALAIVAKLPPLHRTLLLYIIRFLQVCMYATAFVCVVAVLFFGDYLAFFLQTVGNPTNQGATKMNYDNLAMVWAPNFLRCPSEDPMVIFNNTKREMSFVRLLVLELNTDEVAGIQ